MIIRLLDDEANMQHLRADSDDGTFLCNGGITGRQYDKNLYISLVVTGVTFMADGSVKLHEGDTKVTIINRQRKM